MAVEIGAAWVTLIPSARGFGAAVQREISGDVDRVGRDSGRRFGSRFTSAITTAVRGFRLAPVDVGVRVDSAAARADLTGVRRQAADLNGQRVRVLIEANQVAQALPLLAGLAASLTGVVAAAAPAAGAVVAVGSAGLALGQGLGVVKLALSGTGDAIKLQVAAQAKLAAGQSLTAAESKKLAEAMAGLSPAAQGFVTSVGRASVVLGGVRTAVQGALLPQLGEALTRVSSLAPIATTGLSGTARVIGDLATQGARMVTSGPWRADFATILAGNTRLLGTFGTAGLSLADALRNVAVAALPLAQRFADLVARGSAAAAAFLGAKRESGELGRFFTLAGNVAGQLGRILGNVIATLGNLGRAAFGSGTSVLGFIEGLTGGLRRLSENQGLARIVTQIVALGGTAVLLTGVAGRFVQMGVAIGRLAGYAVTVARFVGLFTPLGAAVALAGAAFVLAYQRILPFREAIDRVGGLIRTGFGPALTALGAVVSSVFAGRFSEAAEQLRTFASAVATGVRTVGPQIAQALLSAGRALVDWIAPRIGPAVVAIGGFIGRIAGWIVGTGLPSLARAAVRLGESLVGWVGPRLGPTLAALGQFIAGAARWVVGTGLPTLGRAALSLGTAIVGWVGPRVGPLLSELGKLIGRAASWVTDTGVPMLVRGLIRLGTAVSDWVMPRLPALLGQLGNLLGRAVGWILGTGLPLLVGGLLKLSYELVKWVAPRVGPLLLEMGKLLGSLLRWVVTTGIPGLVKSMLEFGRRAVTGFIDAFRNGKLAEIIGGIVENMKRQAGIKLAEMVTAAGRKFGELLEGARGLGRDIGGAFAGLWEGAKRTWRLGAAQIKVMFANVIGDILDLGAKLPGPLGDKFREAAGKVRDFKDAANRELAAITKETRLSIAATYSIKELNGPGINQGQGGTKGMTLVERASGGPVQRARGGPVRGPGTATSDSIPAVGPRRQPYRLSNGEWVLNAKAVRNVGGFAGAAHLQALAEQGALGQLRGLGLARGGPIELAVHQSLPDVGAVAEGIRRRYAASIAQVRTQTQGIARTAAEKARKEALLGGTPYGGALRGRSGAYGGVYPHVAAVGDVVRSMFGIRNIGGVAGRPGSYSDHPRGLALDFMTYANKALGNRVAGFLNANWRKFQLKYLIWNRRITTQPNRWRGYRHPLGRTDPTSMHEDHPHASFLMQSSRVPTGTGFVRTGNTRALGGPIIADAGTLLRPRTAALNLSARPERVLSPRQNVTYERSLPVLDRLVAAVEAPARSGAAASSALPRTVILRVDGREFTAYVDERVDAGSDRTARRGDRYARAG